MQLDAIEILGYVASAIVAVSLTMSSIVRLRVLNLIGSIVFTIYGVIIHAYPVAVFNAFVVFVNLYFLNRIYREREYFRLLEVDLDDEYLREFVAFHSTEIGSFVPSFDLSRARERPLAFFVLRDMVPAGLFIGEQWPDGTLHTQIDYVIPGFRDLKAARYVFGQNTGFFRQRGITRIVSAPGSAAHTRYLERIGFRQAGDAFVLEVR